MSEQSPETGISTGPETGISTGSDSTNGNDSGRPQRRRLDPLSIAALTVISLAVAIFVTLIIVEVFGSRSDDAVDVTEALDTPGPADDTGSDRLEVGQPAPDAELELLDGGSIEVADLRGGPVVINFWSSTCAPCLAEMPDFESVHVTLSDQVQFLGVDVTDSVEAGREMVEQTGVTYPNGRDPRGEVMAAYGGIALPRTVLLDAEGNVASVHNGAMTADELTGSLTESGLI